MHFQFAPDLLSTNRPPNEDELAQARRIVADYRDELQIVRQKISDTEASLQRLKEEQNMLLDDLVPFERIISPLRRIPEDIYREIFMSCISTEANPTMSSRDAPVLLTRITSGMRRIALTTPTLWAAIHIPIFVRVKSAIMDVAKSVMEARKLGVEEWLLRRSGQLPLCISVTEVNDTDGEQSIPEHLVQSIIQTILSCCSRWKDINLFLYCTTATVPFLSLAPEETPQLCGFTLRSAHMLTTDVNEQPAILRSKNIRKIGGYSMLHLLTPISQVCWSRLTHLNCNLGSPAATPSNILSVASILRECYGLINLSFRIWVAPSPLTLDDISLPFLQYLDIDEFILPGIMETWQSSPVAVGYAIHAPLLETLTYNFYGKVDLHLLFRLLQRSPKITTLALGDCMSPILLNAALKHVPRLETLAIRSIGTENMPHDVFLSAFVTEDSPLALICPRLQHLQLERSLSLADMDTLRNFIMRKSASATHLARWKELEVTIVYGAEHNHAINDLIKEMEDMKITLGLHFYPQPPLPHHMHLDNLQSSSPVLWPTTSMVSFAT